MRSEAAHANPNADLQMPQHQGLTFQTRCRLLVERTPEVATKQVALGWCLVSGR
jgi:hypothetical protein